MKSSKRLTAWLLSALLVLSMLDSKTKTLGGGSPGAFFPFWVAA